MKEKTRLFVYINAFAAAQLDNPIIKDYISKKLNMDDWRGFKNDMTVIPDLVDKETVLESFFDGISLEQYVQTMEGGTYINPMYPGLMFSTEKWESVINSEDFDQSFFYLDIPFEIYDQAMGISAKMTRELYESQSSNIQSVIESMREDSVKNYH
jgi:hypothetical protein